jgi:hypothetical protein
MAQVVRLLPVAKQAQFQTEISACEICGGGSVNGSGVCKCTSVLPCQ